MDVFDRALNVLLAKETTHTRDINVVLAGPYYTEEKDGSPLFIPYANYEPVIAPKPPPISLLKVVNFNSLSYTLIYM